MGLEREKRAAHGMAYLGVATRLKIDDVGEVLLVAETPEALERTSSLIGEWALNRRWFKAVCVFDKTSTEVA